MIQGPEIFGIFLNNLRLFCNTRYLPLLLYVDVLQLSSFCSDVHDRHIWHIDPVYIDSFFYLA